MRRNGRWSSYQCSRVESFHTSYWHPLGSNVGRSCSSLHMVVGFLRSQTDFFPLLIAVLEGKYHATIKWLRPLWETVPKWITQIESNGMCRPTPKVPRHTRFFFYDICTYFHNCIVSLLIIAAELIFISSRVKVEMSYTKLNNISMGKVTAVIKTHDAKKKHVFFMTFQPKLRMTN